jgi:hypothetical protein
MAFDLSSITSGPRTPPPRLMIYGPHGVGKTTLASQFPTPVIIQTEDGLGMLETPAFPLATTLDEVFSAIGVLVNEQHAFKTVVLDSADWLDLIVQQHVKETHDDKALSYGKDALLAAEQWRVILDGFAALRGIGMTVVLLAHCEVKRFDPPDGDSFERYQPKLQARASALVQEWCDAVLFANFKTFVKSELVGARKDQSVKKALASGERLLHTGERPAYLAKNRYSLPPEIPMSWAALNQALPIPF